MQLELQEEPHLYVATVRARRSKQLGIIASLFLLATATGAAIADNLIELPSLATVAWLAEGGAALAAFVSGSFWVANKGLVHVEWHANRLWIESGVPPASVPAGTPLPAGSVLVRDTGTERGNGAFAAVGIPAGSYVGQYEGVQLTLVQYYALYADGVSDYCIALDGERAIDGSGRACDTSTFSPCHINHSRQRFNVARRTLRGEARIELFATRAISADEELLLDYGRKYWQGREDLEQP